MDPEPDDNDDGLRPTGMSEEEYLFLFFVQPTPPDDEEPDADPDELPF